MEESDFYYFNYWYSLEMESFEIPFGIESALGYDIYEACLCIIPCARAQSNIQREKSLCPDQTAPFLHKLSEYPKFPVSVSHATANLIKLSHSLICYKLTARGKNDHL